jgi:hypothetical protein
MEPEMTRDPWLRQFPEQAQPLVIAWFCYAAGQGAQSPEAVLEVVARLTRHKLDWAARTYAEAVLREHG